MDEHPVPAGALPHPQLAKVDVCVRRHAGVLGSGARMVANVPALWEQSRPHHAGDHDLFSGRSNAVSQFATTASTTTTTVTAPECVCCPPGSCSRRARATPRGALASTYVSAKAQGSFTVTHANNSPDRSHVRLSRIRVSPWAGSLICSRDRARRRTRARAASPVGTGLWRA